jgi:hypothetical protein
LLSSLSAAGGAELVGRSEVLRVLVGQRDPGEGKLGQA